MKTKSNKDRIENIEKELTAIRGMLTHVSIMLQRKMVFVESAGSPNPLGKKKHRRRKLVGAFKHPFVRDTVMSLRKEWHHYTEIAQTIKDMFPDNPEMHVSRSSIHTFYQSALKGRLREYGIDVPGER